MKLARKLKLAAIFTGAIALSAPLLPAVAQFTEAPVDGEVVAVAVPAGAIGYNLNVIQQIPGGQQCFAEQGSNPTIIDPLWTTFDFTGSCNKATDSNGYSVRLNGEDTSLDYRLDIVPNGDNIQLVAKNFRGSGDLVVGQTGGKPAQGEYVKINLNPGWEFTKKAYEGKKLGHFFLSGDSTAIAAAGDTSAPVATPTATSDSDSQFTDIDRDIYKDDIEQAVALGFIAGFNDNTFRPTESLTREQLVSMAFGALETVDGMELEEPSVATQPYPDVASDRWSANKIQWAKENDIVAGYPDGTFKPGDSVTRAELIAVLQNVAKFAEEGGELATNQEPVNFADTSNHWGAETISTMSAYCGVASPYKEVGDSFNPDTPAERDYAAAATLRTRECLTGAEDTASAE